MSVLEFISSLKWPLLILILVAFSWWRLRKNPELGTNLLRALEGRNVRVSIAGQEVEVSHVEQAAAVAASSDAALAQIAQAGLSGATPGAASSLEDADVLELRRTAVEELMTQAAGWGWATAQMGFQSPPHPSITWNEQGEPEIGFGSGTIDRARQLAIWRRLDSLRGAPRG